MDNLLYSIGCYLDRVLLGVDIVGTARAIRGEPPKDIKNISDSQFNTLNWINDERKFHIKRSIDNSFVTMITTI